MRSLCRYNIIYIITLNFQWRENKWICFNKKCNMNVITMESWSKWVWSGNTTITNCRPTHGTLRTIIKASNRLSFPCQDDFKLERTQSNAYQNKDQTQNNNNKKKQWKVHKTMYQQQQNHRRSSVSHWGLKCILLVPNLRPRLCCYNVKYKNV